MTCGFHIPARISTILTRPVCSAQTSKSHGLGAKCTLRIAPLCVSGLVDGNTFTIGFCIFNPRSVFAGPRLFVSKTVTDPSWLATAHNVEDGEKLVEMIASLSAFTFG